MSISWRSSIRRKPKRVLVKLGSLVITTEKGQIKRSKIKEVASDIAELRNQGVEVILVSSGAINAGRSSFTLPKKKNLEVSYLQSCSALGQPLLMAEFQSQFNKLGLNVAQLLVTHEDIKNTTRYFNFKSTLEQLLSSGVIPIINENDSVSFAEISVGDNDQLAAMVGEMCQVDALCMLSSSGGVYDKDPGEKGAQILSHIEYTQNLGRIKTLSKNLVGRGGMATKLLAVKKLTPLGAVVIVAGFEGRSPVLSAFTKDIGTFFAASTDVLSSRRKARLLSRVKPGATVFVDGGALKAILGRGSLLPVGIRSISGAFRRGDVVSIKHKAKFVGYGISEYDSKNVDKIKGLKSSEIINILGFSSSSVVIHRDNFLLKGK